MSRTLAWIAPLLLLPALPLAAHAEPIKLKDLTKETLAASVEKYLAKGENRADWAKKIEEKKLRVALKSTDIKTLRVTPEGEVAAFEWNFVVRPPLAKAEADALKSFLTDFLTEAMVQDLDLLSKDDVGLLAKKLTIVAEDVPPPNTAPTIRAPALAVSVAAGTDAKFDIALGDQETPVGKLKLVAVSQNEVALASKAIRLSGTGAVRSVRIPSPAVAGDYRITFTVTDEGGLAESAYVTLRTTVAIEERKRVPAYTPTYEAWGMGTADPVGFYGPFRRLCGRSSGTSQFVPVPVRIPPSSVYYSGLAMPYPAQRPMPAYVLPVRVAVPNVVTATREQLLAKSEADAAELYDRGLRHYWGGATAQAVEHFAAACATSEDACVWTFYALALTAEGRTDDARGAARMATAIQILDESAKPAVRIALERIQGTVRQELADLGDGVADATAANRILLDHRTRLAAAAAKGAVAKADR